MRLAIQTRYKKATASVWHADALELLPTLPANSVSLIVSSPPYCIGKEYDRHVTAEDFVRQHEKLFPLLLRLLKPGGSLCWQIGHHVRSGRVIPLDALVYGVSAKFPELVLRNRIIWSFNHGVHCSHRFSGRHETVLWFTKGDIYRFNLDAVRVPQLYPGKRHYKGPNKGEWSGNPLGKNPGDVWNIPNVNARHVEKMAHPCQFPTALVRRFVLALTEPHDMILDPFIGSGTTCVTALQEQRNFVGCDIEKKYLKLVQTRLDELVDGKLRIRTDKPVRTPRKGEAVAIAPPHFAAYAGD